MILKLFFQSEVSAQQWEGRVFLENHVLWLIVGGLRPLPHVVVGALPTASSQPFLQGGDDPPALVPITNFA